MPQLKKGQKLQIGDVIMSPKFALTRLPSCEGFVYVGEESIPRGIHANNPSRACGWYVVTNCEPYADPDGACNGTQVWAQRLSDDDKHDPKGELITFYMFCDSGLSPCIDEENIILVAVAERTVSYAVVKYLEPKPA